MTATATVTDDPQALDGTDVGRPTQRRLVLTDALMEAQGKAHLAVRLRCIALWDGPPGTGKTAALLDYCSRGEYRYVVVTIVDGATPKQAMDEIARAVLGRRVHGTLADIRNEVLAELRRSAGRLVIAVDEAQNLRAVGIKQLRYLSDRALIEGFPFALLLVGHGVDRAIARSPELTSRVKIRCRFRPLSDDSLLQVLGELDSRLAVTSPSLVRETDAKYCQGNLRAWTWFLDVADTLLGPPGDNPTGLTARQVQEVVETLGLVDPDEFE